MIELPFGPGKRLGDTSGVIVRLLGGWRVTAGFFYEAGLSFNVVSGTNSFSDRNSSRANHSLPAQTFGFRDGGLIREGLPQTW